MASETLPEAKESPPPPPVERWTEDEANRIIPWRLIDHKEYWNESLKEAIGKSERLNDLMKRPPTERNEIVKLPKATSITRHFYCAQCAAIPFPWAPNPVRKLKSKKACNDCVFLCSKGHTICRTCYQSNFTCVLSVPDCDRMFGVKTEMCMQERNSLVSASKNSIGRWGVIRLCMGKFTLFPCAFLTEMITEAEFACKNYYDWCSFRGRGYKLFKHESHCPFNATEKKDDKTQKKSKQHDKDFA